MAVDPGKLSLDPDKYVKGIMFYENDESELCEIMEFLARYVRVVHMES